MRSTDLRGTWPQALSSLFLSILFILTIRWAFFEPYVIPSGSMIPTLLIHDHILVNKLSYGVRVPFSSQWLVHFEQPERGDVIVFKSVEQDDIFIVKRVIGIPGDKITIETDGTLIINGAAVPRRVMTKAETAKYLAEWPESARGPFLERSEFAKETLDHHEHVTISDLERHTKPEGPFRVSPGQLFMMGDNRDNSSDSRVWGTLPIERILGRAQAIWLSCEEILPDAGQICDPQTIRWSRLFKGVR